LPSVLLFDRALACRILAHSPVLEGELRQQVVEPLCGAPELLATLECFVDEGGNALRTAARLRMSRSTFYAHAHRIEQLTGVRLTDPQDHLRAELSVAAAALRPPTEELGKSQT